MDGSYTKPRIVRGSRNEQNHSTLLTKRDSENKNDMRQLTIVADDSPLQQKSRRVSLSENGWELCEDAVDGEVIDFPAQSVSSSYQPRGTQSQRPPFIVITVDKRSRLLSYESHYVPANKPELAPTVRAAVLQVLPPAGLHQAETLLSQLTLVENQDHEFYEIEAPDAISVAAHNYRQRRRQDILAELIELKDCQ